MKKLHQKDELKMYCQRWHNRFGERSCRGVEFRIKGGTTPQNDNSPPKEERGMALLRFVSQADTSTVRMGSEQAAGGEDVAGKVYIYNDRVIATDGVDDKKIIVLNEETAGEINKSVYEVDSSEPYSDLKGKIRKEFSKQGIYYADSAQKNSILVMYV